MGRERYGKGTIWEGNDMRRIYMERNISLFMLVALLPLKELTYWRRVTRRYVLGYSSKPADNITFHVVFCF